MLSILLSASRVQAEPPTQCYFPDGSASTDVPCSGYSGDTAPCCADAPDWKCLPNGLCEQSPTTNTTYRGSCTDKTWGSPRCPQYCTDVNTDVINAGAQLWQCSNNPELWFCIHGRYDVSCGQGAGFNLNSGYYDIGTEGAEMPIAISTAAPTLPTSNASSRPPASSSAPSMSPGTAVSSPESNAVKDGNTTNVGAAVGGGVAAGVAVILIASLVCCIWWRRRLRRAAGSKSTQLENDKAAYHGRYAAISDATATHAGQDHRWHHSRSAAELDGRSPQELPGRETDFHELN